jgi:hypothetical protein
MRLTSWILDRLTPRRAKTAGVRQIDEVRLYLRRLEDRRVLSLTAVPDAYFVEEFSPSFSASPQLGVLSNDFDTGNRSILEAVEGSFSTAQGGTVTLDQSGAFTYIPPTNIGPVFVDQFTYLATNGNEFSSADVTFFVGEIAVPFNQPTPLPIFGVETQFPSDFVEVTLFSSQGASLTIADDMLVSFTFGNNGDSDISFTGTADEVNRALDTLEYRMICSSLTSSTRRNRRRNSRKPKCPPAP